VAADPLPADEQRAEVRSPNFALNSKSLPSTIHAIILGNMR
jgi:hypothetical protein